MRTLLLCWIIASWPGLAFATLIDVTVPAPSVEGNLMGIPSERTVSIYLPPGYESEPERRYPTLYVLHGIMDRNTNWTVPWNEEHPGFDTIQALMDEGIERGILQEMILVIPDCDKVAHYTDSPVRGGWGRFVAADLVSFVDRHYRTIRTSEARGITGHSMGGHGAIKLGMQHPELFSVVYGLNPSLLGWGGDIAADNPMLAELPELRTLDDLQDKNFYIQAVVLIGQSFAPNPDTPLMTDLPFDLVDGAKENSQPGHDAWSSQMLIYMIPEYLDSLRRLRGLAFDSAFVDEYTHIPPTCREFSQALTEQGIAHRFEMYNGDHRNRLWGAEGRLYTEVLPYFSRLLVGEKE